VVRARKHAKRRDGIARKGGHGKEPATIAGVRLVLGMLVGSTTIVVVMYNAIRMDVRASVVLVRTPHTEIIDQAMNRPCRINEG
jgi:hypothetical protein